MALSRESVSMETWEQEVKQELRTLIFATKKKIEPYDLKYIEKKKKKNNNNNKKKKKKKKK